MENIPRKNIELENFAEKLPQKIFHPTSVLYFTYRRRLRLGGGGGPFFCLFPDPTDRRLVLSDKLFSIIIWSVHFRMHLNQLFRPTNHQYYTRYDGYKCACSTHLTGYKAGMKGATLKGKEGEMYLCRCSHLQLISLQPVLWWHFALSQTPIAWQKENRLEVNSRKNSASSTPVFLNPNYTADR